MVTAEAVAAVVQSAWQADEADQREQQEIEDRHAASMAHFGFLSVNTVEYAGKRYSVSLKHEPWYQSGPRYDRKTRIFVDGPGPVMDAPEISRKGDDPESDKAWKAYNREEIKVMQFFAAAVGFDPKDLRFDRKCGCSMCPCSPGFKAKNGLQRELGTIWVIASDLGEWA
jgi:hypothetical protein